MSAMSRTFGWCVAMNGIKVGDFDVIIVLRLAVSSFRTRVLPALFGSLLCQLPCLALRSPAITNGRILLVNKSKSRGSRVLPRLLYTDVI